MTDSPTPTTAAAVIDLLKGRGVLSEIGMTDNHARTIKARGWIPPRWHHQIVTVARRHSLPISHDLLAGFAAPAKAAVPA